VENKEKNKKSEGTGSKRATDRKSDIITVSKERQRREGRFGLNLRKLLSVHKSHVRETSLFTGACARSKSGRVKPRR